MSLPPFETVVAQHGPAVLRVCRAVLPTADADDAWSATFLAALQAYPRLRPDSRIEAWLVTIAHRKALDIVRARRTQPMPVSDLPERPSSLGEPGAGHPELWQAVATLPDKQRTCVAYRYLGGLSYAEIADLVGGSAAAARRATADGLASLRRRFADSFTDQLEGASDD